jgi:hypothetical protein
MGSKISKEIGKEVEVRLFKGHRLQRKMKIKNMALVVQRDQNRQQVQRN